MNNELIWINWLSWLARQIKAFLSMCIFVLLYFSWCSLLPKIEASVENSSCLWKRQTRIIRGRKRDTRTIITTGWNKFVEAAILKRCRGAQSERVFTALRVSFLFRYSQQSKYKKQSTDMKKTMSKLTFEDTNLETILQNLLCCKYYNNSYLQLFFVFVFVLLTVPSLSPRWVQVISEEAALHSFPAHQQCASSLGQRLGFAGPLQASSELPGGAATEDPAHRPQALQPQHPLSPQSQPPDA